MDIGNIASIGPGGIEMAYENINASDLQEASIGPGGIEIGALATAHAPGSTLQSDRVELKYGLGDDLNGERDCFNRTGWN